MTDYYTDKDVLEKLAKASNFYKSTDEYFKEIVDKKLSRESR